MKVPGGAKLRGSQVPIPGNIVYDTGKATIRPESEPTLNQLKQFLDENPQVTQLRIEGHTDTDGDDQMNLKLSGDRAVAVIKWLESRGVRRNRLLATGFGEQRPLKPNDSPANKEQNRRTEFHVATLNGRNFLGRDPTGGGTVFQ
jgi:outer membrane protein OmpA-like peptidoglycan-associated protein